MDDERSSRTFWIGFFLATAAIALYFYWQRQQRQMQAPGVLMLGDRPARKASPGTRPTAADVAAAVTAEVAAAMTDSVRPATAPARPAASGSRPPEQGDRLEAIKGIGAVYARRLRQAGIHTYTALAAQSPERIAAIVKLQAWQAGRPAEWIAEARSLAES